METIAKHAQGLVYSLLCLMPSLYQKASLNALLGLFLEAQGHALPQHTQSKSPSSLSSISQPLRLVNKAASFVPLAKEFCSKLLTILLAKEHPCEC